jgi:hypothetical protein
MTSILRPDLVARIAEIRDRQGLELVSRLIQSELAVLQTQVDQLQQLSKAVEERMRGMGDVGKAG